MVRNNGVSVAWLMQLAEGLRRNKCRQDQDLTVWDVCQQVVLPKTRDRKCTFVDLLDPKFIGKPFQGTFVSQARSSSFSDLVASMAAAGAAKPLEEQFVWLDIFSVSQWQCETDREKLEDEEAKEVTKRLKRGLRQAMRNFDERAVFLDSWSDPTPLRRSWCVWELYDSILRQDKAVQPLFAPGQAMAFLNALRKDGARGPTVRGAGVVDTRRAQTTHPGDKALVDATIQKGKGFAALDEKTAHIWLTGLTRQALECARLSLVLDDLEDAKQCLAEFRRHRRLAPPHGPHPLAVSAPLCHARDLAWV